MTASLATSHDGQWTVVRDGRELALLAATGEPIARATLDGDDADVALVGPPDAVVAVVRDGARATVVLYEVPSLEAAARLPLDAPLRLAAATGPRIVLVAPDAQKVTIVREAGTALAHHAVDVPWPIEHVVGLEKNQLLFDLGKKLEVWDGVTGRPLLRPQFPLPPAPRVLGACAGHLWAIQPGKEDVYVYRLSDGRPFRHHVAAAIERVVSHAATPVIVLVTDRGLVRLHCYAHSLGVIESPWLPGDALALQGGGEDVALIGIADGGREPWRVPLAGTAAPIDELPTAPARPPAREPVGGTSDFGPRPSARENDRASAAGRGPKPEARGPNWRDALAAYGAELVRGHDAAAPSVPGDCELAEVAARLGLGDAARRTLVALYAAYLVGEPALAIARLARATADWREPLGRGELAELAMLHRRRGRVSLRPPVTDLLDGAAPRAIRLVGNGGAAKPALAGAFRVSRDGRTDETIEAELAASLGRIAIASGPLAAALLEARLYGASCIALAAPAARPQPWPRDAALVLVLYGSTSSWVADLPALAATATAS